MADQTQQTLDLGVLNQTLPTILAAQALNRKPQTLRKWACLECGPIRPIRINGRLAWRVADLKKLLLSNPEQGAKTTVAGCNHG